MYMRPFLRPSMLRDQFKLLRSEMLLQFSNVSANQTGLPEDGIIGQLILGFVTPASLYFTKPVDTEKLKVLLNDKIQNFGDAKQTLTLFAGVLPQVLEVGLGTLDETLMIKHLEHDEAVLNAAQTMSLNKIQQYQNAIAADLALYPDDPVLLDAKEKTDELRKAIEDDVLFFDKTYIDALAGHPLSLKLEEGKENIVVTHFGFMLGVLNQYYISFKDKSGKGLNPIFWNTLKKVNPTAHAALHPRKAEIDAVQAATEARLLSHFNVDGKDQGPRVEQMKKEFVQIYNSIMEVLRDQQQPAPAQNLSTKEGQGKKRKASETRVTGKRSKREV